MEEISQVMGDITNVVVRCEAEVKEYFIDETRFGMSKATKAKLSIIYFSHIMICDMRIAFKCQTLKYSRQRKNTIIIRQIRVVWSTYNLDHVFDLLD